MWIRLRFPWSLFRISNTPPLYQTMAWCRPGDKPLSETMMVKLPTHIYVPRPQWIKWSIPAVVRTSKSYNWIQIDLKFCQVWMMIMIFVNICISDDLFQQLRFESSALGCAWVYWFNTSRPKQNGRHFADDILICSFFNENARISLKISLKFVPKFRINNIPALVQIMAWRRPGDKPLSEPMMVSLLTHYASLGLNEF